MKSISISIPNNILHIAGGIEPGKSGGVELYISSIIHYIKDFNHLFVSNEKAFHEILKKIDVSLIHIHTLQGFQEEFYSYLVSLNIPIVITLHDWGLLCPRIQMFTPWGERCIYGPGKYCPACYIGKIKITKHLKWNNIILSHLLSIIPEIRKGSRRYKNHWRKGIEFLKEVKNIIAPSEYVKSQFESFGVKKIRLIPHGIRNFRIHTKVYKSKLGYVGTIVPHKGLHILLGAVKNISQDFTLNIFGKIGDKAYFDKCKRFIDNKRIFYRGEELNPSAIFSNIDILIVPSIWEETYGMVIDEAYRAKIPVIASRIGGIPEHIIEGKSGYLFEPGNEEELKNRLKYVMDNYQAIEWQFPQIKDIKTYAEALTEIYREAIIQ